MSQLIVCQNNNGIVLAADSAAVDFKITGEMVEMKVDRLIKLGPNAAILAGGAPDGVHMCESLRNFISEERLTDIQDIYAAALPFLASEYERFMRKTCEVLPVDPMHHIYFVLAGLTEKDSARPFRIYMLWAKKKLPQLDGDEIACAYSAPRRMSLEYRLNQMCKENAALNSLLEFMKETLEKLGSEEEVGPPYHYAFISREGFKLFS